MPEHDPPEEMLTVDETSAVLRVHPNTTRTLIKAGKIPAFRVGHQYRIRRSALRQLEQGAVVAGGAA